MHHTHGNELFRGISKIFKRRSRINKEDTSGIYILTQKQVEGLSPGTYYEVDNYVPEWLKDYQKHLVENSLQNEYTLTNLLKSKDTDPFMAIGTVHYNSTEHTYNIWDGIKWIIISDEASDQDA